MPRSNSSISPCRLSSAPRQQTTVPEHLITKGWAVLPGAEDYGLGLARALGRVVPTRPGQPLIHDLMPTTQEDAHPRSLSAIYGLDGFPFHLDDATRLTPCRYVLLSCVAAANESPPTLLLDWTTLFTSTELARLASAIVLVRNGRASFYTPLLDPRRRFLRYDPGCIRPASHGAVEAMSLVSERISVSDHTSHRWSQGEILLIDNWRLLHARPAVHTSGSRRLKRIMVT